MPAIFSVVYGNTIDTIAGDKGVAVPTYKSHVQGMSKAQQHQYLITFPLTRGQTGIYNYTIGTHTGTHNFPVKKVLVSYLRN